MTIAEEQKLQAHRMREWDYLEKQYDAIAEVQTQLRSISGELWGDACCDVDGGPMYLSKALRASYVCDEAIQLLNRIRTGEL